MRTFCPLCYGIIDIEDYKKEREKMKESAKKTVIVYILRIMYNFTSEEFPVTQTSIVTFLRDNDIECSRKTVGRNLKYLMDIGVPIKRKPEKNGGYYYDINEDTFFVRIKLNDKGVIR